MYPEATGYMRDRVNELEEHRLLENTERNRETAVLQEVIVGLDSTQRRESRGHTR